MPLAEGKPHRRRYMCTRCVTQPQTPDSKASVDAGNVAKLLSERHRVMEWLEETKRDIMEECSFTSLVHKVCR